MDISSWATSAQDGPEVYIHAGSAMVSCQFDSGCSGGKSVRFRIVIIIFYLCEFTGRKMSNPHKH